MYTYSAEARDYNLYKIIERYKNIIQKEKDIIAEKEMIIDSLNNSLVLSVKSLFIPYSDKMMDAAWKYHGKQSKECEKDEEYNKQKRTYKHMEESLIRELFEENERKYVKLNKIMSVGYGGYGYDFELIYKRDKKEIIYSIVIPVVSKCNKENLPYMYYGMYSLKYRTGPSSWSTLIQSYKMDNITEKIKEHIISYDKE